MVLNMIELNRRANNSLLCPFCRIEIWKKKEKQNNFESDIQSQIQLQIQFQLDEVRSQTVAMHANSSRQ
jgi:hypothetical protein